MPQDDFEAYAKLLEAHADYRVLRRLVLRDVFAEPGEREVRRGAIVDVETTGLSPEADKIIELGVVLFEYSPETGEVFRVLDTYSGLEDPGRPIPDEVSAIHGITDRMVAGQRIADAKVAALLQGVSIVIAHKAEFDRPFLEQRLPMLAQFPWACSLQQIGWSEEGFGAASLEHLAYRCGFFFEGHRSEIDCRALLEVIRRPLPVSGQRPLKRLLERLEKPDWRVYALGSPFESKDKLKARDYRWDDKRRTWHRALDADAMRDEIAWLKANVYKRDKVSLEVEKLDAMTRFSGRAGKRQTKEF
jgi:DNA polymerase-3 subunit epsilon